MLLYGWRGLGLIINVEAAVSFTTSDCQDNSLDHLESPEQPSFFSLSWTGHNKAMIILFRVQQEDRLCVFLNAAPW